MFLKISYNFDYYLMLCSLVKIFLDPQPAGQQGPSNPFPNIQLLYQNPSAVHSFRRAPS